MTHALLIYTEHCTLPVLLLHEFRVLLLMHKFVHHKDKLPNVFNNFFLYQTTLFICMILGIELTYIDTELIHHMAIAV